MGCKIYILNVDVRMKDAKDMRDSLDNIGNESYGAKRRPKKESFCATTTM